jgi:hypothetical protein
MYYSSYKSEQTCRFDIKDLLEIQVSFLKIVSGKMRKKISINMVTLFPVLEPMFFFDNLR